MIINVLPIHLKNNTKKYVEKNEYPPEVAINDMLGACLSRRESCHQSYFVTPLFLNSVYAEFFRANECKLGTSLVCNECVASCSPPYRWPFRQKWKVLHPHRQPLHTGGEVAAGCRTSEAQRVTGHERTQARCGDRRGWWCSWTGRPGS